MCLIAGFINFSDSVEKSLKILEKLHYRGIDGKGIYFDGKIIFSKTFDELKSKLRGPPHYLSPVFVHALHSIVGFNPQPFEKDGNVLIANCEIYNWERLKDEYELNSKNDAELILDLIEKLGYGNVRDIINLFEGPFAFAYYNKQDEKIILARDIIGEKPLFYFHNDEEFAFASEKKGIESLGKVKELNPREILIYKIKENKIEIIENKLEYTKEVFQKDYEILKQETFELLEKSILKMVPKGQKIGLLFSGGIDSTFIAYILKKNNIDFTCYTAKLEGGNIKEAPDYVYAREIAERYDFNLEVAEINVRDLVSEVKEVIFLIEDREYIKVSVALPFILSCKRAKEDGVKVMFSGLGSEELFAGYRRHKKVEDVNLECYKGLLCLHERDLYRDDVICMSQNQELRLPFLDRKLIEYALKIPVEHKLNLVGNRSKIILRDIAKDIGLDEKYSERQKKAAQYGSKFDKGLMRLAKDVGMGKQEYLDKLK